MFDEENEYSYCDLHHSSHQVVINPRSGSFGNDNNQINDKVDEVQTFIKEKVRQAEMRESGWNIMYYNKITLHISRYNNNSGGSYIKLPFRSNYIINVNNPNDECCFLWSIIAHLHPAKNHVDRLSNYNKIEYINEFDLEGDLSRFPYTYDKIEKFCKKNKDLIEINVFEINDNKKLTPVIINHDNYVNQGKYCNLLYYRGHYVLCKNISPFISNETTHAHFPCLNCMTSYSTEKALREHKIV